MMILGDNLFYGDFACFRRAVEKQENKLDSFDARIFAYPVRDPERFGVVEFDPNSKKVLSLEENLANQEASLLYQVFIFTTVVFAIE